MVGFVDDHRKKFGVEPICAVLPIVASRYCELTEALDEALRSAHTGSVATTS